MIKKALILSCFLLSPSFLMANGLELYSYNDDHGQLVVVDSIERIPKKFRSRAVRNFIPSFKDGESRKINTNAVNNVKLSNDESKINSVNDSSQKLSKKAVSNNDSVELVNAPEEVEKPDLGLDEAASILNSMAAVLQNNKQIYNLVLSTKIYSPAVKNIHTQNIAMLARIKNPKLINWKRTHPKKNQWSSNAAILIERFRTIQYTVSKWFSEAPGNLLSGFPAFIKASEGHLAGLNSSLEELKEVDKKQIEEESKKKKK